MMNASERHKLTQELGGLMSAISEDCYRAGWLGGTEYSVPELCHRTSRTGVVHSWGHGNISVELATRLIAIADRLGHWADLDEEGVGYVPFQPFPLPADALADIERQQNRSV
jgi:hypothetical protein